MSEQGEAVKEFERENRYVVIKYNDAFSYLSESEHDHLRHLVDLIAEGRKLDGKLAHDFVCVADDWPEYETVWQMIEARVTGKALTAKLGAGGKTNDPLGCLSCSHKDCGRYWTDSSNGRWECRAMADNACARGDATPQPVEVAGRLERRLEIKSIELENECRKNQRLIELLSAIHMRIYPQLTTDGDGKTYRFNAPNPHDYLQALADCIRAIPAELETTAPKAPELVEGLTPVDPALLKPFVDQRKKDIAEHVAEINADNWAHGVGRKAPESKISSIEVIGSSIIIGDRYYDLLTATTQLKRMQLAYECVSRTIENPDLAVNMTRLHDLLGNEDGSEDWSVDALVEPVEEAVPLSDGDQALLKECYEELTELWCSEFIAESKLIKELRNRLGITPATTGEEG